VTSSSDGSHFSGHGSVPGATCEQRQLRAAAPIELVEHQRDSRAPLASELTRLRSSSCTALPPTHRLQRVAAPTCARSIMAQHLIARRPHSTASAAKGDGLIGAALSASRRLPLAASATSIARRPHRMSIFSSSQHMVQMLADQRDRQSLQIELQAARQDRDRQLLRVRGGEQELDVRPAALRASSAAR
jgi:hypothetical protein